MRDPTAGVVGLRILLVANAASIHTTRWARGLVARGHEVAVASEGPPDCDGVSHVPLPPVGRGRVGVLRAARALADAVSTLSPDVVHAHYVSHYGLIAAGSRWRPLVMSAWGADVEVFPRRNPVNRVLLRWLLSRADCVTASGTYLASVTERHLMPGRSCRVVPFGVDPQLFCPRPEGGADVPRIVCNKHLETVYGVDLLLRALDVLDVPLPWECVVLGEGAARQNLMRLAERLGLGERVTFAGAVEPAAVARVLQSAAVAVYPSRRESFGVAALEASASAVPVVAARVGGLCEVVHDGETGILVAPEDPRALAAAIQAVLQDAETAALMGRRGRQLVMREYTEERALDLMEQVYDDVGRPTFKGGRI